MTQKENSKLYRLEEMSDSMIQSIENAYKVVREQKALITLVKSSNKAKDFESFVKELDTNTTATCSQIKKLLARKDKLDKVIELCKNNEQNEDVMNLLLDAFGIFEE